MKKSILKVLPFLLIGYGATAQNVNIPDANFKAYLVGNSAINTNSDTEIQVSEAIAFTGTITCPSLSVSDLTGIEAFTNITGFSNFENYFSTLDFSQNTALTTIECYYSYYLTSIDLSQNIALTTLDLSYSPTIVNLNLSPNVNLEFLGLEICSSLSNLDISQNTALTYLTVRDCNLSSIDVSNNKLLQTFKCEGNNLNNLDVTKNTALTWFSCFDNNLGILDVSRNTAMTTFQCFDNNLTILNMKNLSTSTLTSMVSWDNSNLTCIDVDDVSAATSAWTNIDPASSFSLNCQIDVVNAINVYGQSGNNVINTPSGTLQMYADIVPTYADDATYTWSVTNGTGTASIDANGLLTAMTDGNVTVTATANDASGVSGSATITIANQSIGIYNPTALIDLTIYPNPVKSQFTLKTSEHIQSIVITNLIGETVSIVNATSKIVDVTNLIKGIYIVQILTEQGKVSKKIVKE